MIRLPSKSIPASSSKYLAKKQKEVDDVMGLQARHDRARKSWEGKSTAKGGNFQAIKDVLIEMCPPCKTCVYCGRNTATDIEHIYPKRLFPERAFVWENYLLSCGDCNSTFKGDKFAVFAPIGSQNIVEISPEKGIYSDPPTNDGAFIDPRSMHPEEYIWLDIQGRTFSYIPNSKHGSGTREEKIAEYTIRLLQLNHRSELVEERKKAAVHYVTLLERYVAINSAMDLEAINRIRHDWDDEIPPSLDFASAKAFSKESIRKDIQKYHQPAIWLELKRQRNSLPKTKRLFDQAPEALTW